MKQPGQQQMKNHQTQNTNQTLNTNAQAQARFLLDKFGVFANNNQ